MKTPRTAIADIRRNGQLQVAMWPAAFVILALQLASGSTGSSFAAFESLIVLVLAIIGVSKCSPRRFWSPSSMFLMVAGVFHLGLTPYWLFGIDPLFPRPSDYEWFLGPVGVRSLLLVSIGFAAFAFGNALIAALSSAPVAVDDHLASSSQRARHYSIAGAGLMLAGIVWWLVIAITSGGPTFFLSSYIEFLASTATTQISNTYFVIGLGFGLTLIAPLSNLTKGAIVVFAMFAVVAFFLGLRGEILFPLAVGASVLAFRRRMPRMGFVLVGGFVLLSLVNAAKTIRQMGIAETSIDWSQVSPLAALGELGSTLRVVATVVTWHDGGGEPFRGGDTYFVTVARALETVFASATRLPASADFRLMNVEIISRAGGIGGSAVGEAYHNFGVAGVVLVTLLMGLILGYFSRMPANATNIAVLVCLALPLFNHIRNSFVPVIPVFLLGLVFVLIVRAVSNASLRKHPRL